MADSHTYRVIELKMCAAVLFLVSCYVFAGHRDAQDVSVMLVCSVYHMIYCHMFYNNYYYYLQLSLGNKGNTVLHTINVYYIQ